MCLSDISIRNVYISYSAIKTVIKETLLTQLSCVWLFTEECFHSSELSSQNATVFPHRQFLQERHIHQRAA